MLKVDHDYWKMPYLKSAELEFLQIKGFICKSADEAIRMGNYTDGKHP